MSSNPESQSKVTTHAKTPSKSHLSRTSVQSVSELLKQSKLADDQIPSWWFPNSKGQEHKRTRTQLLAERKRSRRPHPSYDIDGDGAVGHKDFFLANLFDRNKDGILDKEEREECLKAL